MNKIALLMLLSFPIYSTQNITIDIKGDNAKCTVNFHPSQRQLMCAHCEKVIYDNDDYYLVAVPEYEGYLVPLCTTCNHEYEQLVQEAELS